MRRLVAGLLGAFLGANALVQLLAPYWWYGVVPGVTATGPFNPHFVRDVGAAYLVVAGGLAAYAWRGRAAWPALAAAAGFLTLHAGVHVFDAVCGPRLWRDVIRDLPGVYLPALITLALAAFPDKSPASKEITHAQSHPRPSDRPHGAHVGL
jgi:hypothetical protein